MRFSILSPRRDVASAEEVRALRARRGYTVDEMADEVHASPREVSAWEAGTVAVPPEQALRIHWMEDVDAWGAALDRTCGQACPWVRENAPNLYEQMFGDVAGSWYAERAEVRTHVDGCAACQAAWERAKQAGGFPPEPDTSDSLRARYSRWVARFPGWTRGLLKLPILAAESATLVLLVWSTPARDAGFLAHLYGAAVGLGAAGIGFVAASFVVYRVTLRPAAALLPGLAAGIAGLLGWAMMDAAIDLGNPLPWAVAAALGLAFGFLGVRGGMAHAARQAAAPGAEPAPLPAPFVEWTEALERGEPVRLRDMIEVVRLSRGESPSRTEPGPGAGDGRPPS